MSYRVGDLYKGDFYTYPIRDQHSPHMVGLSYSMLFVVSQYVEDGKCYLMFAIGQVTADQLVLLVPWMQSVNSQLGLFSDVASWESAIEHSFKVVDQDLRHNLVLYSVTDRYDVCNLCIPDNLQCNLFDSFGHVLCSGYKHIWAAPYGG